jgi:hypothetical protein
MSPTPEETISEKIESSENENMFIISESMDNAMNEGGMIN